MACINPDGTLTDAAVTMMKVIAEHHSLEEAASISDLPLFLVRATARDLMNAGLVLERDGLYYLTDGGSERLKKTDQTSAGVQ
jgi:predicted methyltransferase